MDKKEHMGHKSNICVGRSSENRECLRVSITVKRQRDHSKSVNLQSCPSLAITFS